MSKQDLQTCVAAERAICTIFHDTLVTHVETWYIAVRQCLVVRQELEQRSHDLIW